MSRRDKQAIGRAPGRTKTTAYDLCLYVSDMSPRSSNAIENVRAICDEYLPGRYRLQVIDIYQSPRRMLEDQVVAAPTLIKRWPSPVKLLVGDLSDRERVISGLNLKVKPSGD